MPPEIEIKDYMDALVIGLRREQDAALKEYNVSIERVLVSLERVETTVSKQLEAHESRIVIIEKSLSNYQGRLWMLGAGITVVIIAANFVFARFLGV